MHQEFRRVGPPGTGKTTWIVRQAKRAVATWCKRTGGAPVDCHDVLIATLTTGAATELRSRGVELPKEQIGTLHSHAFRALDRPKMCVGAKEIAQWNAECDNQMWNLTPEGGGRDKKEGSDTESGGDRWRQMYHLAQSRLSPRDEWGPSLTEFVDSYERWKRVNDYMDFSDLIHRAWSDCETAPGEPSIIFIDEAQDHDAAELRLARKWATECDMLIVVGDPDQAIYEFRGADPDAFYASDIPEENTQVLTQSYRVPRAVHTEAMEMIRRCGNRKEVSYLPRDHPGKVIRHRAAMQGRGAATVARDAVKYIEKGKTVMALATCHYMLRGLSKELKALGIPFWNPFSKTNTAYNPLMPASGVGGRDRLLSFLVASQKVNGDRARLWTARELMDWTSVCRSGGLLRHGAKVAIKKLAQLDEGVLSYGVIQDFFESKEVFQDLADSGISTDWLKLYLHAKLGATTRYAIRVVEAWGIDTLRNDPKMVIGTIHSVKGGEADVVYVSPECSPKEKLQLKKRVERDSIYRKFYVAMTRSRDTLVLLKPSQGGINWLCEKGGYELSSETR